MQLFRSRRGPPGAKPSLTLTEFLAQSQEPPSAQESLRDGALDEALPADEGEPRALEAVVSDLASLPERALAFGIDAVLIYLLLRILGRFLPWLEISAGTPLEPAQQLTFAAWATGLLILYFTVFEVTLARTPGKRILGLEVQDVNGGRPTLSAILFRNAFRIELLIPPFYLVPVVSLVMMLTSRHTQRPGDFLAHTTVRRSRPTPPPLPSGEPIQE